MNIRNAPAPQVFSLFMWLCLVSVCLAGSPAGAQIPPEASSGPANGQARPEPVFSLRKQPSVRLGPFRLDVRAISEAQWRDVPDDDDSADDAFEVRRVRVGVDGRITRYLEYQVERELRGANHPWRDVYVVTRVGSGVRVQAGRFKMPFSFDQTTGVADGNFVHRSIAANVLAPGRDVGVMAFGAVFGSAVKYEAGVFHGAGDNGRAVEDDGAATQRTVASRIVIRPWTRARSSLRPLRSLTIGAALTAGRLPAGLNSLRAETVDGKTLVDRVYVSGLRQRFGVEASWRPGPVSIQGEFIRASDERRSQGIDNEDLPGLVQHGWYMSATWLLTGEEKKDTVKPIRPLFRDGAGAFELASRVEAVSFHGVATDGGGVSPRAVDIPEGRDTAWTIGLNWYPVALVKIQLNAIQESRATHTHAWNPALRIVFRL